jgi:hypothetical protein
MTKDTNNKCYYGCEEREWLWGMCFNCSSAVFKHGSHAMREFHKVEDSQPNAICDKWLDPYSAEAHNETNKDN